jgi:hypothetical protein
LRPRPLLAPGAAAAPAPAAAAAPAPAAAAAPAPLPANKADDSRKEIIEFFRGPIRSISIDIDPQQMERLKRDERNYVEATVNEGGKVYKNVAVKLKGSAGSFQSIGGKPGLTLNFDKFKGAKRFYGMKRFHLNNAVQDGTYLNELIAGEIARKAGVPASRCTHAFVKINDRDVGLYVLKEGYTKDFLADFFKDTSGDLYDGGFVTDISETTEKDQGDFKDTADLKALIEACREGDHTKRWEKLSAILDIEQFISYLAIENILSHWDGYSFNRNNYRFYKDPTTGKFNFILHGMDQTLVDAGFAVQRDPGAMVSSAVMRTPKAKALYLARLESMVENVLKPIDWSARVAEVGKKVRDALAEKDPNRGKEFEGSIKTAQERVANRIREVEKQLAAIPKPVIFGEKGVMKLAKDWRQEGGGAEFSQGDAAGRVALRIKATGNASASWRKTLNVPAGSYRFEAKVRTAAVSGEGAGLRISGGDRSKMKFVKGDSDWQTVEFPFDSAGGDITLVAELRGDKGEAWFDNDSLQLVQLQ